MTQSVGRIPIRIQPWFFLLAGLIGYINGGGEIDRMLTWIAVVFFSVLVHEYGHALTSIYYGQTVRIELTMFGGVTHRAGPDISLTQDFIVVAAGPLFGFMLAAIAGFAGYVMAWPSTLLGYALYITCLANIFWSVLNLLPVGPLDGGRLTGILLEGMFGHRGLRINFLFGAVFGASMGLFCFVGVDWLIGLIFFLLSFESLRAWMSTRDLSASDRDRGLQRLFRRGERAFQEQDFEGAAHNFDQIRSQTHEGLIYLGATQYMAMIMYARGELEQAYNLLKPLAEHLIGDPLRMLHRLAYQMANFDLLREIGARAYQDSPSYEAAYVNALAFAKSGQAREAVGWLECAVRDGIPDLKTSLTKSEFDPIRQSDQFQHFVRNLADAT